MFRAVGIVDPVKVQHDELPEIVKYYDYTDKGVAHRLIMSVPNGCVIRKGIGGVGNVISDHYINMGEEYTGNTLTWSSIVKAITVARMEDYTPTTMLIHPIQVYDLLQMGKFISASESAFYKLPESKWKRNIEGMIGIIGGMHVVVSADMTSGMSLLFDDNYFPTERSAGVLLCGGRTEIS
jgi:hypothetical protein